jgi:hypothetical protein
MFHNLNNNRDCNVISIIITNIKPIITKKQKIIQTGGGGNTYWFKEKCHARSRWKRNRKQQQKQPTSGKTSGHYI